MAKKKRKRRLKKKAIILFIIIIFIVSFLVVNSDIKNIYISGNNYYTDQQIIDMAKINNYPKTFSVPTATIRSRIKKQSYIYDCIVYKSNFFRTVTIKIKENYPLFYYQTEEKTVLYDGSKSESFKSNVTVINQIPDTVYKKFYEKMKKLDVNVLNKISEIKYSPEDVDDEKFFITMNDGNYVYVNIKKFDNLNKYTDIVKKFNNKKGTLHLDEGDYFEIFK